ncbi:VOC family protein [Candidatus Poriferisodalis sp.]|uniref:VOC family protein n=1 Tax=Candidatus Poriferisodalis sp. TaxID=3101277 RepID=UPI003B012974
MVQPIPDDYPRISVALSVDGGADAIAFYTEVLGMTERMRIPMGDKIGHSELTLGDSLIMVADEFPEMGFGSPKRLGGTPVNMSVYVEDVDATFAAALAAGATEVRPLVDQFYGDRSGTIEDPWGHHWHIATHIEDIDPDEMARRSDAAMAEMSGD